MWRLASLPLPAPPVSQAARMIIPVPMLVTHALSLLSRAALAQWCRLTTLAMQTPRAAATRVGTDHVWRRDLFLDFGVWVLAPPGRTLDSVGSAWLVLVAFMSRYSLVGHAGSPTL